MDQAFILPGTFLIAAGVNLFCLPSRLSLGGLTSIGTVLQYLFGVRISVTNLVGNLLLFLIGWKSLGRAAVVKTLSGVVFLSLFLEVTRLFPVYTGDLLIAAVSGGALMGLGVGLVVRRGASTGGSDCAGLMLRRALPHVSIARLILIIDCVIVAIAGVAFRSWPVTFYSLVSLFISEKFTDLVATFGDSAKSVQIFSAQTEAIAAQIMRELERGVTGIHARGMYTGRDSLMLLCVVSNKQLPTLVQLVRRADPAAFLIVTDSREVWGDGFKTDT